MTSQGSRRPNSLSLHDEFSHQMQFRKHVRKLEEIRSKPVCPSGQLVASLSSERPVQSHVAAAAAVRRQMDRFCLINVENESLVRRLVDISKTRLKNSPYSHIVDESVLLRARSKADSSIMLRKKQNDKISAENEKLVQRIIERIHSNVTCTTNTISSSHKYLGGVEKIPNFDQERCVQQQQLVNDDHITLTLPPITKSSTGVPHQRHKHSSSITILAEERQRYKTPILRQRILTSRQHQQANIVMHRSSQNVQMQQPQQRDVTEIKNIKKGEVTSRVRTANVKSSQEEQTICEATPRQSTVKSKQSNNSITEDIL